MKIGITIDDNLYARLFDNGVDNYDDAVDMAKAIRKGTPLPNGRLIDADELLKRISEKAKTPSLSDATINGLCGATAIIYDMLIESGQEKDIDKESGNGEIQ